MKTLYPLFGMRFRGAESLVKGLPNGEPLTLVREPTNPYDSNAVQVHVQGQHVAFIPKHMNGSLARAIDAGTAITTGRLVHSPNGPCIEIEE